TCDCSRPFVVTEDGKLMRFDLITAWEVLEHVPEERLPALIQNVHVHLAKGGLFIASIPFDREDGSVNGEPWHVTWRPRRWWDELFRTWGFIQRAEVLDLVKD